MIRIFLTKKGCKQRVLELEQELADVAAALAEEEEEVIRLSAVNQSLRNQIADLHVANAELAEKLAAIEDEWAAHDAQLLKDLDIIKAGLDAAYRDLEVYPSV